MSNTRLVHHARRLIEQHAADNAFVRDREVEVLHNQLVAAYVTEPNPIIAAKLHVELDRLDLVTKP